MAKAFGRIVHLSLMTPFWLMLLLGNVKPLFTMFLLGLPVAVLYMQLDAEERTLASWKSKASKHVVPAMFFALAMSVFVADLVHVVQAFTEPSFTWKRSAAEALEALACTSNIASMLNIIGLVGLHSENADEETAHMIFGDRARDPIAVHLTTVQEWIEEVGFKSKYWFCWFPLFCFLPLVAIAVGSFLHPLREHAVRRMRSKVQQWYVRFLYYVYKPLFHVLMAVSLIAIVANCWLFVTLFLIVALLISVSVKFAVMKRVLKMRHAIGLCNSDQASADEQHVSANESAWLAYQLLPGFVSVLLPMAMPLTMRLLAGEGYVEALVNTWQDLSAATYVGAMQEKVLSTFGKFTWIVSLSSCVV